MTHTTDSPAVSVIVPVYNEEENVPILQAELRAALRAIDHEFIFVDDGSADHTVERIEAAPNTRVIRFEKNAGQSAAIYAGLQAAHGAILVLIDGDLQNDPADIPKLLDEISPINFGISAGSFCKSPSIRTTIAPRDACSPA